MEYITIKRFKRNGISGYANIPYGTSLELRDDGKLYHKDLPVCVGRSFAAHEHFACNYDGKGFERGLLSHAIIKALAPENFETPQERNDFWQVIWNDTLTHKYRRKDHFDTWLWSDDFYNAPIEDLKYIAGLVGVKGL